MPGASRSSTVARRLRRHVPRREAGAAGREHERARPRRARDRRGDLVALVGHDPPLDLVAVAAEQLGEEVAAAILARRRATTPSETVSTAAFRPRSFVFSTRRDVGDDHLLVDRLRHVVDGQRRDRCRDERLHLDAGLRRRLGRRRDLDRVLADLSDTSTCESGSGVAERDQLARPLRGHDPGELRRRERVALRQLAQALRGLRRHPDRRAGDGPAARQRLRADVDHAHRAGLVDVREVAHRCSASYWRGRGRQAARRPTRGGRGSRTCFRIASSRARRSASAERERGLERIRLAGDVERIDRQRPGPELLVRAGVLGQDEHAVPRVDERRLLGDEVEPVEDGVHEQDVELLVRGDRPVEVVGDPQLDRRAGEARLDRPRPPPRSARRSSSTPGCPAATGRAGRASRRARAARDGARAAARTPGDRAGRSSTGRSGRRGGSSSRVASREVRAPARAHVGSPRAP